MFLHCLNICLVFQILNHNILQVLYLPPLHHIRTPHITQTNLKFGIYYSSLASKLIAILCHLPKFYDCRCVLPFPALKLSEWEAMLLHQLRSHGNVLGIQTLDITQNVVLEPFIFQFGGLVMFNLYSYSLQEKGETSG